MKRLLLLFAWATLAIACDSPSANNAVANRSNSSASNASANTSSLNENVYMNATNSELGSFKPYVGKTASEIKLWQNKEVDPRLRKLMGADYATMKKFWNVETPLKKFGDFLMMTGCEQDNCAENRYVILMSTSGGNMNVVHIGKDTIKDWKEYSDIVLPPPFAEELAAMKSRK